MLLVVWQLPTSDTEGGSMIANPSVGVYTGPIGSGASSTQALLHFGLGILDFGLRSDSGDVAIANLKSKI
jgi:hypothetical protein